MRTSAGGTVAMCHSACPFFDFKSGAWPRPEKSPPADAADDEEAMVTDEPSGTTAEESSVADTTDERSIFNEAEPPPAPAVAASPCVHEAPR